jgi:protein-disulfide isomerase
VSNKIDRRMVGSRARGALLFGARPFVVALAGALLGACVQGESPTDTGAVSEAADGAHLFAGVSQAGDAVGSPTAPLTLVDFSDLRCRHCRDFDEQSLPVLMDRYVRTGRVRVVLANLPILGQSSVDAARMAVAVGLQGHMFEFVAAFFAAAPAVVTDEVLEEIAGTVPGVDVAAALAARKTAAVTEALADTRQLAAQFEVSGTPSFLLGKTGLAPQLVPGARATKPETFTAPIDALLAEQGPL